jgi:hypothetical protein
MEQFAKKLLKRLSNQVSILTDKKISQASHAPKENEWRAYIWQTKPHWEDIAWRVKEPNMNGQAEVHLGFYSEKPSEILTQAIAKTEEFSKGNVGHIIKNENGIRLVWQVNLNNQQNIDILLDKIFSMLSIFMETALAAVCLNANSQNRINDSNEYNTSDLNNDSLSNAQLEFLETNSWWRKNDLPMEWANSREFILEAVKKDGRWIEIAPANMKNDIEIVSFALAENGYALDFVSEEMKNNKDVVLLAVSNYGNALEYASESLKSDNEVIMKAVSQNFDALAYANPDFLENLNFVNQLLVIINKDNYKDLFYKLSPSMRIEKNVLELITPVYRNANNWIDAKYSKIFLDYLTYFDTQDPYENKDNLIDFTNEYEIPLSSNHFEALRDGNEILIFQIDNSNYAWEELGGSERFTVIYNLNKNVILPNRKESPYEDNLSLIKKSQYLDSMHVGIYELYHDDQSFIGDFYVCNYFEDRTKNEQSFNISYQGGAVADYSCDIDTLNKFNIAITPSAMYQFISDVLRNF